MANDHNPAPESPETDGQARQSAGQEGAEPQAQAQSQPQETEHLLLTLQDAQAEAEEYRNQALRAKAELANLQRRNERELEQAHKFGLERFARELLPVIDSLELGLNAAAAEAVDPEKLREGMDLTLKMLTAAVEKFGLRVIDPQGEKFNPELHQAMTVQQAPGVEPNRVLTVYQKGYLLHDRLLRPAMVVVSAGGSGDGGSGPGTKIDQFA